MPAFYKEGGPKWATTGAFLILRRGVEQPLAEPAKAEQIQLLRWSVGRADFDPNRYSCVDELLADADCRMYEHKQRKQNEAGWSA